MDSEKFKKGDLVRLKSGGPKMTVSGYSATFHNVICTWFDAKNEMRSEQFEQDALDAVADPDPKYRPTFVVTGKGV